MIRRVRRAPAASVAVIANRGRQVTRIKHREYLDQVLCPQAAFSYVIQPTNTSTFTWLPRIAQCYEMYRLVSMTVHYENAIGTEAAGVIHMAYDYDVLDDIAPDAQSMSQFTTYVRTGLWCACSMPVNPRLANRIPWHYTATHGYPAISDQKSYDIGRLWVLGIGTGNAVLAGELYVEYEFEFCSPTVEVESLNVITFEATPTTSTGVYEQAVNPTISVSTGQQLLEYVGRSNVSIEDISSTINKFVDVYKALHNFSGEIVAEGGVPLSAASRAKYEREWFQQSSTAAGPFKAFYDDTGNTCQWRTPVVDHGQSASDAVAGQLAVGSMKLIKDYFYAFPWLNTSTGTNTGWSTPAGIPAPLRYYISERIPSLNYALPSLVSNETCSSKDCPSTQPKDHSSTQQSSVTVLESEEDEEHLVVRRRR